MTTQNYITIKNKDKISTACSFELTLDDGSPRHAALASQGSYLKDKFSGPTPEKRIRNSRDSVQQCVLTSPPGNSDSCLLRTTLKFPESEKG